MPDRENSVKGSMAGSIWFVRCGQSARLYWTRTALAFGLIGQAPFCLPEESMFDRRTQGIWPVALSQIETTVSAYLGPGRVPGNKQDECFSRQISMYLAKHVGGWSTPQIGRFYNGRHHTTVLYAIQKIELLRSRDESVNALLEVLTFAVNSRSEENRTELPAPEWKGSMIEAIAAHVIDKLTEMQRKTGSPEGPIIYQMEQEVAVDLVGGDISSSVSCSRNPADRNRH